MPCYVEIIQSLMVGGFWYCVSLFENLTRFPYAVDVFESLLQLSFLPISCAK